MQDDQAGLNDRAYLTEPYTVYLAAFDIDVTLPAGTEFDLYVVARGDYIGIYTHPDHGPITVDTPHAVRVTPLAPGMFILHARQT
jgi:hypothetical protein